MKNYRILQIHNFYQIPGGEDVVVRNEKRLLEEHGHKVYTYYRSNSELNKKGIAGKLLSIVIMYIGRLGPLTIATLWHFSKGERVNYPEGNITIG